MAGAANFLASERAAEAGGGGGCLLGLCYDKWKGGACAWAPVGSDDWHGPAQTATLMGIGGGTSGGYQGGSIEPILMRGTIDRIWWLNSPAWAWSGGIPGVVSAHGAEKNEFDWHMTFKNLCVMHPDGSCGDDEWIKGFGQNGHASSNKMPVAEHMTIRRWEHESTDYFFYEESQDYLWSQDMTQALGLKPGVMGEAVDVYDGEDKRLTPSQTDFLGRKTYIKGYFVIDQPDDVEGGHGGSELHPIDLLAVDITDLHDPKEPSWSAPKGERSTYRVTALTNSNLHRVGECPWVPIKKTIEWEVAAPALAGAPNKVVNAKLSRLMHTPGAGVATVAVDPKKTMLVDGKSVPVIRFSVPMPAPDWAGDLWVGDLSATVSDMKVDVDTKAGYPKSVGYFRASAATSKKCDVCVTTTGSGDAATTSASGCKDACVRRYDVAVERAALDSNFTTQSFQWLLDGTKAGPKHTGKNAAKEYAFTTHVGVKKKYESAVRLDVEASSPTSSGQGGVQHTVSIPRPAAVHAPVVVKLNKAKSTKTDLFYEWSTLIKTPGNMASPLAYLWEEGAAPNAASKTWKTLGTNKKVSGTITSTEAKPYGFVKQIRSVVTDAYAAEKDSDMFTVHFPHLDLAVNVNNDPAKDGKTDQTTGLPPFFIVDTKHDYHTKWTFTATPAMTDSSISVTWPVKYEWKIVDGTEFVDPSTSVLTSGNVFTLKWKAKGVGINDCVTVKVTASDQYGHAPSYPLSLCGGVTNKELGEILQQSKLETAELRKEMDALFAMLDTLHWVPGQQAAIPHKPVDPPLQAARSFYYQFGALNQRMREGGMPLQPATLAAAATMGQTVTKLAKLNPSFFANAPSLGKLFYWGSDAQRAKLEQLKTKISPSTYAHYKSDFATLDAKAARGMYKLAEPKANQKLTPKFPDQAGQAPKQFPAMPNGLPNQP
jgi:hypothetical protein